MEMEEQKLRVFCMYFLRKLVLVELSVEKDDTPMVFEVINDRGEALKPFEILKGKMVGLLSKSDTQAYSEKWDDALGKLPEKQDVFFGDYLKSRIVKTSNTKLKKHQKKNQWFHFTLKFQMSFKIKLQYLILVRKKIQN